MHVVAEESGGTALQASRAFDERIGIGFDLLHVVVGTNRYRTQRPRMGVGRALATLKKPAVPNVSHAGSTSSR